MRIIKASSLGEHYICPNFSCVIWNFVIWIVLEMMQYFSMMWRASKLRNSFGWRKYWAPKVPLSFWHAVRSVPATPKKELLDTRFLLIWRLLQWQAENWQLNRVTYSASILQPIFLSQNINFLRISSSVHIFRKKIKNIVK